MTPHLSRVLLVVVVLPLCFWKLNGPAFSQSNADKAELAERVMNLHREEGYLEKALEAAVQNNPAIEQVISKVDRDANYAGWAAKVEETYTIEEMEAYLDFASTDAGRSILRKSTEINAAVYKVLVLELIPGVRSSAHYDNTF